MARRPSTAHGALLVLTMLGACSAPGGERAPEGPPTGDDSTASATMRASAGAAVASRAMSVWLEYGCDEPGSNRAATVFARARAEQLELVLAAPASDRRVELPRIPSASGARYEDDDVRFWNAGDRTRLDVDGRTFTCVQRPPDSSRARFADVPFRAAGQEPGWTVTHTPGGELRYVGDYGTDTVRAVAPAAEFTTDGVRYVVRSASRAAEGAGETSEATIELAITEAPCTDAMSGELFEATVVVTVGERTLRGCGRRL